VRTSRTKSSQSSPPPRNEAERRAARWYRLHAYRVLDHNRWLGGAELDLVVRRGRTLAFVEVKSKRGEGFGDPFDMVDAVKIARVRRAAALWLAAHPEQASLSVRFDVIAVRSGRIEHLPNAF
jgi:putative endonuclease